MGLAVGFISGMFGVGLVMYVKIETDVHLDHILFGDMLGIAPQDLIETGLIALASTLFLGILRKDLLLHAFDAQHAQAIGLPVRLLHYGLLAVLSLVVVGALKAVGMPVTILIDAEGNEVARMIGDADWASPAALAVVDQAEAPTLRRDLSGMVGQASPRGCDLNHTPADPS